jgi:hypothetical protein
MAANSEGHSPPKRFLTPPLGRGGQHPPRLGLHRSRAFPPAAIKSLHFRPFFPFYANNCKPPLYLCTYANGALASPYLSDCQGFTPPHRSSRKVEPLHRSTCADSNPRKLLAHLTYARKPARARFCIGQPISCFQPHKGEGKPPKETPAERLKRSAGVMSLPVKENPATGRTGSARHL